MQNERALHTMLRYYQGVERHPAKSPTNFDSIQPDLLKRNELEFSFLNFFLVRVEFVVHIKRTLQVQGLWQSKRCFGKQSRRAKLASPQRSTTISRRPFFEFPRPFCLLFFTPVS